MGLLLVAEALAGGTAAEVGKSGRLRDWLDAGLAERLLRFDDYGGLYLTLRTSRLRARKRVGRSGDLVGGA